MAASDGLDLFSLATQDDAAASSVRAMAVPVALVPVAATAMLLGIYGALAADVRSVAVAVGLCAVTAVIDLVLQRRWHPVRQRLGNALLSAGDAAQGRDWSPLERMVARKALQEYRRRGEGDRSWKDDLVGKLMWPVYVVILANNAGGVLELGGYGVGVAAAFLAGRAARAAYRHDILRPVLARIAKRQLALLEGDPPQISTPSA